MLRKRMLMSLLLRPLSLSLSNSLSDHARSTTLAIRHCFRCLARLPGVLCFRIKVRTPLFIANTTSTVSTILLLPAFASVICLPIPLALFGISH